MEWDAETAVGSSLADLLEQVEIQLREAMQLVMAGWIEGADAAADYMGEVEGMQADAAGTKVEALGPDIEMQNLVGVMVLASAEIAVDSQLAQVEDTVTDSRAEASANVHEEARIEAVDKAVPETAQNQSLHLTFDKEKRRTTYLMM